MPNPFQKAPDDEQSMFEQLRAQDQRRIAWQRQATPQIAAAIGQFHALAPHAGPGVALAVGLGNVPPANAAKVANDAAAQGVSAAPRSQPDRSNPNFESNRQIAQIPGLTPEQRAAALRGVDIPGMTDDQLKQEQKILGVTEDMLAPKSKGAFDFDWSNPFEGFNVVGEGLADVTRGTLSVAQSGLEEVQNRATVGVQTLQDLGSSLKEGDLSGAGSAWLKAQTMVTPFSVSSVALAPSSAETAAQSLKATTAYQSIVEGLSTGEGWLPNPESPAGRYQSAAAREVRGVNSAGQAWTVGRQVASLVSQPGTTPYKVLSGLTDAAVAWYGDPALVAGKAVSDARAAAKVFTPARDVASAEEIARGAASAAEVRTTTQGVARSTEAILRDTEAGKAIVADVKAAKSPEAVAAIVGRDFGEEGLTALAQATSDKRVINLLTSNSAADSRGGAEWFQTLLGEVPEAERIDRVRTYEQIQQRAAEDAQGVLLQAERPAVGKLTADGWLNSRTGQFVLQKLAEDTDALSVHNALGRAAPVDVVNAIAKARTPEEVANILRPVLGIEIKSLNSIRPASTFYNASTAIKRQLPLFDDGGNLISRQFAQIPSKVLKIGRDATPRDLTAAVNDADNWMRLLEVPYEDRTRVVSNFIDNVANGRRFDAASDLMTAMRKGMEAQGIDGEKAKQLTRMFDDYDKGLYGVDEYGKPTTWNLLNTADGPVNTSLAGPGLLSERMSANVEMPDPRVVKRLTSMFGRAISTNEGQDLKLGLAYAERITNVWKRFAILRVATAVRVMGDEQARLAASDMPSMFHHPLHWIMSVAGKREGLTAFGEHFDDAAALGHMDEYRKALGKSFFGALNEPDTLHAATYANGNWRAVSKFDEPSRWREGMVDELRQLAADPVARRVAKGDTTDQILDWLKSDEGAKTRAAYDDLFRGPADDAVLRDYIDNYTRARIDTKIGDNQALRNVIANNRLPDSGEALYEAPVANRDLTFVKAGNPGSSEFGGTNRWLGATVKDSEGQIGVVTADLGNGRSAVTYGAQGAFENGDASDPLKALIADWQAADHSPESVKWAERVKVPRSKADMSQRLDRVTNTMVSALFDVPVSKLTRSAPFREAYYGELARLADRLTPEEANRLIKNISVDAADKGFGDRISDFLGGDKLRDLVVDKASKANGTLTLHDIDQYATGHALDSVMDILYDSSRRSNFGDAMRTVAPFGQAWAEVFSSWGKVIARRPETIRRFQLAVEGARGSGFFYTDPTTGQEVFNVPFSGWLMKRVFGVDSPIKMSVQGLNLAGNFLPTIGPVLQMPAGEVMRRMPTPDFIRAFVLPYGEPAAGEDSVTGGIGDRMLSYALPSWLGKIESTLSSPDSASTYGNTYRDVLRQLATSGEYGNSTDERQRMMTDAENKAKAMTVLRGIAQAFLPSAPSYQPTVDTKQGDVLVNKMAQDLSQWEQEDYDSAIGKFLETYGEGPFIYIQSKTKSVNGGLSASKAFGEWEQSHSRFLSSYPDVAGYFGPAESDFDSEVYNRQLATGERKVLSGDEMLKAADATIARWKYNQVKNQMGDKLNTAQRTWLAGYKDALQKQYPGWAEYNAGTADLSTKIAQLSDAAKSKSMQDNDTAVGVRAYLTLRDQALQEAKSRGQSSLSGDKMADLREWLDNGAHAIAKDHPSFQRLYDNVLSSETAP